MRRLGGGVGYQMEGFVPKRVASSLGRDVVEPKKGVLSPEKGGGEL